MTTSPPQKNTPVEQYKSFQLKLFDVHDPSNERFHLQYNENQLYFNKDANMLDLNANSGHFSGKTRVDGELYVNNTLNVEGDVVTKSNLEISGVSLLNGGLSIMNDKFVVSPTDGNLTVGGTTDITGKTQLLGGVSVGDGKQFSVDPTSGYTHTRGNLDVDGSIVSGTHTIHNVMSVGGQAQLNGGINVNNTKFTVNPITGNTSVDGTMRVAGHTTVNGNTRLNAGLSVDYDKFVVDPYGNITVAGTAMQLGASTVKGVSHLDGGIHVNGDAFRVDKHTGDTHINATLTVDDVTVNQNLTAVGNVYLNNGLIVGNNHFVVDDITGVHITSTKPVNIASTEGINMQGRMTVSHNLDVAGNLSVNTNKITVNGANGDTHVQGTLKVDGILQYKGLDNLYRDVGKEVATLNNRVGGLLAGTTNQALDSLADLVTAFTSDDGTIFSDISALSSVLTNVQGKQELLRAQLLKVCQYLNTNHSFNYMDESSLTKVGEPMVVDIHGTPRWESLSHHSLTDRVTLQNKQAITIQVSTHHTFEQALHIHTETTPPLDIVDGVVCFELTTITFHHVTVAPPNKSSKVLVLKTASTSVQGSCLEVVMGDTVKLSSQSFGSVNPLSGDHTLKVYPGEELLLWARPDSLWSVISTTNTSTSPIPLLNTDTTSVGNTHDASVYHEINLAHERIEENQILIHHIRTTLNELDTRVDVNGHSSEESIQMCMERIHESELYTQDITSELKDRIGEVSKSCGHVQSLVDVTTEHIHETTHTMESLTKRVTQLEELVKSLQNQIVPSAENVQ